MRFVATLALGALLAVCSAGAAYGAGEPARSEFHHLYPLSPTGSFAINDERGSIRIIGWERNAVQVDARECAPTADELRDLTISVASHPNAISVQTIYPPRSGGPFSWVRLLGWSTWCNERPEVDYIVHVPQRAALKLASVSADMTVTGPVGSLGVDTTSGDLSATDVRDVSTMSESGDVTITRGRGTFSDTTVSGDLLFNDAAGDITINSTSGEVRLYSVSGKAVVTTTSGDITARSFSGIARLDSTSGDVSLTLVRGKGIALSASTVSGDIHSDVPMRSGAPVDVRTISGDIVVRSI